MDEFTGPNGATRVLEKAEFVSSADVAAALDHSDSARMQGFHLFSVIGSLCAILVSFAIGGDELARKGFWAGAGFVALANVFQYFATAYWKAWTAAKREVIFFLTGFGIIPFTYYFGPFSIIGTCMVVGVVFTSFGRSRTVATASLIALVVMHLVVALPIIFGWTDDVGIFKSDDASSAQQIAAEVVVLFLFGAGFALGRQARGAATAALTELQNAKQMIGDQQQVLAEVRDQVEKVNREGKGRWTDHTIGNWKVGLIIGRGGMGEVYEAYGTDGTVVALKLLTANADNERALVERFHRELQIAASLKSDHIVRVLEISEPNASVPYLAMERLHGMELAAVLRDRPRLPLPEVIHMLEQVAAGLEVARAAGVVHRDLKPHNIFLHEGRSWKILDFGVARRIGVSGTLTRESIVGTPQYMAPEQAAGFEVTHLADVYALGAITYRCLTGRAPFTTEDVAAAVYQIVNAAPVRPSLLGNVPPLVEDVLAVAMAKDPHKRFQSALEFVQQLTAARDGRPPLFAPTANAWAAPSLA